MSNHMGVRHHFLRQRVSEQIIRVLYVSSVEQHAVHADKDLCRDHLSIAQKCADEHEVIRVVVSVSDLVTTSIYERSREVPPLAFTRCVPFGGESAF